MLLDLSISTKNGNLVASEESTDHDHMHMNVIVFGKGIMYILFAITNCMNKDILIINMINKDRCKMLLLHVIKKCATL